MIKKLLILSFIMAIPFWSRADVSSSTKWQISNTATAGNLNGGGFVTGASGTNYSNQDTAQFVLTTATATGAGNIFISTMATASMVGNIAHCTAGLNFRPGWYQIVSVSGSSITVSTNSSGQSIVTGVASTGTIYIGGAMSLNSTLDNEFFNSISSGNIVYVKKGNYTLGENVVIVSSTNGSLPIKVIGYNTSENDLPSINSGNQPVIALGANFIYVTQYWEFYTMTFTGTATSMFQATVGNYIYKCKFLNSSTSTQRQACNASSSAMIYGSEAVSQNGSAFVLAGNAGAKIYGCYAHDSQTGIVMQSNSGFAISNLVVKCSTAGITLGGSTTGNNTLINNTVVGYSTVRVGNGVTIPGTGPIFHLFNNIVYGWGTGFIKTVGSTVTSNTNDYNNYFNNTVHLTNTSQGPNDFSIDPGFVDISEISGSTAITSGSVLTGGTSTSFANVQDNVDYVRIFSGTGVTVATYLITSHTNNTLTVNNSLGTSSGGDVVFAITTGKNYSVGSRMSGTAFPGLYGTVSTSYPEVGAMQRKNQNTSVFIE